MKLFVWKVCIPGIKNGAAIALADTRAKAIDLICRSVSADKAEALREYLEQREPNYLDSTHGQIGILIESV